MSGRDSFNHLFGPVPSRRLGMSLGIDLVPKKICSLDCVYCEVGRTTLLTTRRDEYVSFDGVIDELRRYLSINPDPDYFTFSGSGEPTLNSRIGDVIGFLKTVRPEVPVAVLTNGTLFSDPGVRSDLMDADMVLPSLDAATEGVFTAINRPDTTLSAAAHIKGLAAFGREYAGKICLEVFILPGYNDSPEELKSLETALTGIRTDTVQLNSLDRPGTQEGLQTASKEKLLALTENWSVGNVEVIAAAPDRREVASFRTDTEAAVLETIRRRPCTLDDLSRIMGVHISELNKYLDVLEAEGRIESLREDRGFFYRSR